MKLKPDPHLSMIVLLFLTSFTFFYCKDQRAENSETTDSKQTAKEFNSKKSIDDKESNFLINAADLSLREIEMAKLAQKNAGSAEIKNLSKRIEEENSKFIEELKKLATSKSITIPVTLTKTGNRKVDELSKAEGNDFDEKYCSAIVEEEKEAIQKYKSATEDIEDIDIKNWANKNLPTLRDNLDHALTCRESHKTRDPKNPENEVNVGKNKPQDAVAIAKKQAMSSTSGNSGATTGSSATTKSGNESDKKDDSKKSKKEKRKHHKKDEKTNE